MRRRILAFFVLATLALDAQGAEAYGRARLLFNLQDETIGESSGVASYSRSSAVLFTHNDSGDGPRFFAIGKRGETLATYVVLGAVSADWEDMARGPGGDGEPALYFGDIGDNFRSRPFVTVYEVPEPTLAPEPLPVPVRFASVRRLQ
ncbi:MAG: hypothetical protein ACRDKJ_00355, partial [Actinomycetota bacterium]